MLHEELIDAEKIRLPLLLCYLEGQSRDRRLGGSGWTMNVVRGARRVEIAADSIGPRGVTLTAGSGKRCWDSATADGLVAATGQITLQSATTGSPSAVVANALARSPSTMFPNPLIGRRVRPRRACLAGVFTLRRLTHHRPTRRSLKNRTIRQTRLFRRVLDLTANRWPGKISGQRSTNKQKMPPARDHGSDGRFSVNLDRSRRYYAPTAMVAATANGSPWIGPVPINRKKDAITLRLVKDIPLKAGAHLEGNPVAGARIRMKSWPRRWMETWMSSEGEFLGGVSVSHITRKGCLK